MSGSLEEAKDRVKRKYLGKAGIHALGIRRSENCLTVYMDPYPDPDRERIMKEIEDEAAPYGIMRIEEERANIGRSG